MTMNGLQAFLIAMAGMLTLITGFGGYFLRRMRNLEAENEATRKRNEAELERKLQLQNEEIQVLRHKLTIAEASAALVPDLQQQINVVCLELQDMRLRLEAAERKTEEKHAEIGILRDEIATYQARIRSLTTDNARVFEANKLLLAQVNAYKTALALVHTGQEDADPESIPGRPKTDPDLRAVLAAEPEPGETAKPITNGELHAAVLKVRETVNKRKTGEYTTTEESK